MIQVFDKAQKHLEDVLRTFYFALIFVQIFIFFPPNLSALNLANPGGDVPWEAPAGDGGANEIMSGAVR